MRQIEIAISIVLTAICVLPTEGAAPVKGWIIKQNTDYRGAQTVYVTPKMGKIVSKDLGVISRGSSSVTLFNQIRKTYMALTAQEFLDRFGSPVDPKRLKAKTGTSRIICGQKCTQYLIEASNRNGSLWYREELWTTKAIATDPKFIEECSSVFDIPSKYGVPLRLVRDYSDGRHVVMMDTLDCKPGSFSDSDFKLSAGFKKVKSEADILMSDTGGDMSDLMDMSAPAPGKTKAAASSPRKR